MSSQSVWCATPVKNFCTRNSLSCAGELEVKSKLTETVASLSDCVDCGLWSGRVDTGHA